MNRVTEQRSLILVLLTIVVVIVLMGGTLITYSGALENDFVNWDDDVYVYENPHIQQPWPQTLERFFLQSYYRAWIPVTLLSHAIDFKLWILEPRGHHFSSIILHSANTAWVFLLGLLLVSRIKGEANGNSKVLRLGPSEVVGSALAAALFSLHPLRVESVAWVSDRKDVLCAFFALPSVAAYLVYSSKRGSRDAGRWLMLSLLLFVCALLSKSVAVALPVVFLLLDFFHGGTNGEGMTLANRIKEKIPFFLPAIAIGVIAFLAIPEDHKSDMFTSLSLEERILLPFYNAAFYLLKTLLPTDLAPVYPSPEVDVMRLAVVVVIGLSVISIVQLKQRRKSLITSWAAYLIMLSPSMVLLSATIQTTADRYAYLPTIAIFLLLGAGIAALMRQSPVTWQKRVGIVAIPAGVCAFYISMTMNQITIWKNSESLWRHTISLSPRIPLPYNNLGLALQEKGDARGATEAYTKAIQLKRNYVEAHLNLGNLNLVEGKPDEALSLYQRAIEIDPMLAEAYNNIGIVHYSKGDAAEALVWFDKVLSANPEFADAHFNKAAILAEQGHHSASVESFQRAAQLGHAGARQELSKQQVSW